MIYTLERGRQNSLVQRWYAIKHTLALGFWLVVATIACISLNYII